MRSSTSSENQVDVLGTHCGGRPTNNRHEPWSRFEKDFKPFKCLGRGGFGVVFAAKHNIDDCDYAVKRIKLPTKEEKHTGVLREVRALAKLQSEYVVRYYNTWEEELPLQHHRQRDTDWANELEGGKILSDEWTNTSTSSEPPIDESFATRESRPDQHQKQRSLAVTNCSQRTTDDDDDFIVFKESQVLSEKREPSDMSLDRRLNYPKSESSYNMNRQGHTRRDAKDRKTATPTTIRSLYIQMELCLYTLCNWMQLNNTWKSRREYKVNSLFSQIVSAVEYVHSKNLIHRDLNPRNILFALDGRVKLGDFGLVTTMGGKTFGGLASTTDRCGHTKRVGTMLYMSPEQRNGDRNYDFKVDIYSMGLTLFELYYPFASEHGRVKDFKQVRQGNYPKEFLEMYPEKTELLKLTLSEDPSLRPTASELRIRWPLWEHSSRSYTSPELEAENVLQILRNQKEICDNICTVMATCPQKLVQYLINKKSADSIEESYLLDLKKFAITLYFYSPETYAFIREKFDLCLPHPSVISLWFRQPLGWPGITDDSVKAIMTLTKEILGCLLVYELKIREGVERTECDYPAYYGYADVGNHLHGDHIDKANEALIIMAVGITSGTKFPIGLFFGKNFTPSQKAILVKLCIDTLSPSNFRIISVTVNGSTSSVNLARCLGANVDTAPFKPYFKYNDTKYYLMIDPKHLSESMKQLFVEWCRLLMEYTFLPKLHTHGINRNELQIMCSESILEEISVGDIGKLFRIYDRRSINRQNYKDVYDQCVEVLLLHIGIQQLEFRNSYLIINSSNTLAANAMLCNLNVLQYFYTDYIQPKKLKYLPLRKLALRNQNIFSSNASFTALGLSDVYKHFVVNK